MSIRSRTRFFFIFLSRSKELIGRLIKAESWMRSSIGLKGGILIIIGRFVSCWNPPSFKPGCPAANSN